MCTTRRHYEYRPVWPSHYTVDVPDEEVLHSEEEVDDFGDPHLRLCTCGRLVSDAVWEECNDLAYICPDRDL